MSRAPMTLIDAINDKHLFPPWFRDRTTWAAWFAFIAALFALPMTADQLAIFQKCTGRTEPPSSVAKEAWLICGRRAGKSFILALIAVFLACFHSFRQHLAPGERGTVLIIATDRKQARVIFRYIRGLLTNVPMLKRLIERETHESFDLSNNITIEVGTASFKSVRGLTIVAALCDEVAFWSTDDHSADPDHEILNAIRPAMATIPNAMLLVASSPYARRGVLWDAYRKHYAKDGDPILVWQAATRTMNPSVPQSYLDSAFERDPASCQAEFFAQFRSDLEAFVSREAVEACVSPDIRERAPVSGIRYFGFTDPSGGSSDSMTLAIAHKQGDIAILDAIRERKPPFSPEDAVKEFAALLKSYGIRRIIGDKYAGSWPVERFKVHGIHYEQAAKPKSDLYRDSLALLNSGRVDLLDDARLTGQLISLERRTARGGKDSIDHPPSGHDDIANAVAGAITILSGGSGYNIRTLAGAINADNDDSTDSFRRQRFQLFMNSGGAIRL
ncbi:MAG: hypothetical protein WBF99_04195 [Xanthobacteraceae bacterium]